MCRLMEAREVVLCGYPSLVYSDLVGLMQVTKCTEKV